ncbi:MAG TPA: hypothetical protein VGI66_03645 [Streptosporangiaceae bacterium]|jgi:hypothetical protein
MAINNYVLTATVTVAAGTPATVVAGEPGTGGPAGYGNVGETAGTWAQPWPTTFLKGQLIALDPAGQLFAAIGSGNLRQVTPAQESGGLGIGTSN